MRYYFEAMSEDRVLYSTDNDKSKLKQNNNNNN